MSGYPDTLIIYPIDPFSIVPKVFRSGIGIVVVQLWFPVFIQGFHEPVNLTNVFSIGVFYDLYRGGVTCSDPYSGDLVGLGKGDGSECEKHYRAEKSFFHVGSFRFQGSKIAPF